MAVARGRLHDSPNLPPLPHVHDESIENQIFTHRSLYGRPTHVFEDREDDLAPDNEKFEHLGDTVLGLVVTTQIQQMYPGLRVGPSTKIRALVVGNQNLAAISVKYKLPDRLKVHAAQVVSLKASVNVQADLFEAYVGGLFLHRGLPVVEAWLKPLFRPYIVCAYEQVRQHHTVTRPFHTRAGSSMDSTDLPMSVEDARGSPTAGHLALFNQHLSRNNREVEWIYFDGSSEPDMQVLSSKFTDLDIGSERGSKTTPLWFVEVRVDGTSYGLGRGNTKKSARNEAAKVGLAQLGIAVWSAALVG
ncbi:ribonuclease III domain-containing protein [Schizophyllum commune]